MNVHSSYLRGETALSVYSGCGESKRELYTLEMIRADRKTKNTFKEL